MTDQSKEKYDQVKQMMSDGKTMKEACKEVGLSPMTYYAAKRFDKPARKKYTKKKLIIHELPQSTPTQSSGFLVVGSPRQLAEFARAYS